ncbi:MAG: YihY/virulence factor BrkB family protein [Terriglobales bacterium]
MAFREFGSVLKKVYADIQANHTMAMAAGLSYYFVMSLFPLLILAASIVAFLPIPNLFDTILADMQRVIPSDSMGLVRAVLRDVITPHKGSFLTVGILGTIWTASGGFASLIEALNVAYDVPETRPFWKTRLLAIGLMFVIGTLMVIGAIAMFLGPQFGTWLAAKIGLSWVFAKVWPVLRWVVAITFIVLAVELVFYWAPNVKQRFWSTLPGASIGVAFWIGASYALGVYFRHFANFNRTYGTLGAAVALMVWLYWSWFVILAGAEINSELLKAAGHGRLELKQPPPRVVHARPAWEEEEAA